MEGLHMQSKAVRWCRLWHQPCLLLSWNGRKISEDDQADRAKFQSTSRANRGNIIGTELMKPSVRAILIWSTTEYLYASSKTSSCLESWPRLLQLTWHSSDHYVLARFGSKLTLEYLYGEKSSDTSLMWSFMWCGIGNKPINIVSGYEATNC